MYAGVFHQPLFFDRVWVGRYGPKFYSVQVLYSVDGALPLTYNQPVLLNCSQEEVDLIDYVIEVKISKSARSLVVDSLSEMPIKNRINEEGLNPSRDFTIGFEDIHLCFLKSKIVKGWYEKILRERKNQFEKRIHSY